MAPPGGSVLGDRYELLEQIGAGGYSEVWRGRDRVLARPVAIKLLHLGYAQHAEALARFRAEAQHAGALAHENIARVYDYGEADPPHPPFLVMELVDGPSLAGALANGPLDPARTLDIVAQTASGLHAAHLAGLVHRDIKPGNLLLAPGGVVKITDFGIAHAAGSAPVTSTGQLVGTPGYLPPERAMGGSATPVSDLYALGVVAYECLAGSPPFTGPPLAVALAHRERPMPPLPAWVPADVASFVMELTAKDPAARPRSAGEVAQRASQLASRLAATATAQVGAPWGDPAVTVADQTVRYPGVAPVPDAAQTVQPTRNLPTPPATAGPPSYSYGPGEETAAWQRHLHGRAGRIALPVAAAVLVIVAVLLSASVINPGPAPRAGTVPPATPSATGPARVTTVNVKQASLIGQPVAAVARQLRQQGLSVRVAWRPSKQQRPGTVLAVQPAGQRPVGSTVTLTAAAGPPGHGHGHGHRHGGNQQGQQGGD